MVTIECVLYRTFIGINFIKEHIQVILRLYIVNLMFTTFVCYLLYRKILQCETLVVKRTHN